MHPSAFDYIQPTEKQLRTMKALRVAAKEYAKALEEFIPEGPDKTTVLRSLRITTMWANVAVTRHPDGAPRGDEETKA